MEKALLAKAQKGNAEAFMELAAPFSGMVYRHCLQVLGNREDAEDAAQEAMLRAFRAMPRFLRKSSFPTWLFRIAHNTCLDMLKRPGRKREAASLEAMREMGFDPAAAGNTPEIVFERKAEAEALKAAIGKLPEAEQALLNLRYGENKSYQELAKATGLREGTVKSKLNRAKERLRRLLEEG